MNVHGHPDWIFQSASEKYVEETHLIGCSDIKFLHVRFLPHFPRWSLWTKPGKRCCRGLVMGHISNMLEPKQHAKLP